VSAPTGFTLPIPPGPPVSAPTGSPWPARRAYGTRPRTLPPTHHTPAYAPRTTILRAHTPTPAHTQLERWRSPLLLAGGATRICQRRGSAVPFASISVPGGRCPFEDTGRRLVQGEVAMGLQLVVPKAQWPEIGDGGTPARSEERRVGKDRRTQRSE